MWIELIAKHWKLVVFAILLIVIGVQRSMVVYKDKKIDELQKKEVLYKTKISDLQKVIEEKEKLIDEMEKKIKEKEKIIEEMEKSIDKQNRAIDELRRLKDNLEKEVLIINNALEKERKEYKEREERWKQEIKENQREVEVSGKRRDASQWAQEQWDLLWH